MKRTPVLLVAMVVFSLTAPASAAVEPIEMVVVQNQPIDLYFPNEFDLTRKKLLTFDAVTNTSDISGSLATHFDWFGLDGMEHLTPVVEFPVAVELTWQQRDFEWLDFCPQEVSLHFRLADAPAMGVLGKFTDECIVPEPSSILAAAMGMLGLGLAGRRRRA